eukprot:1563962-Alexandrium_andersonii.AAC.1
MRLRAMRSSRRPASPRRASASSQGSQSQRWVGRAARAGPRIGHGAARVAGPEWAHGSGAPEA